MGPSWLAHLGPTCVLAAGATWVPYMGPIWVLIGFAADFIWAFCGLTLVYKWAERAILMGHQVGPSWLAHLGPTCVLAAGATWVPQVGPVWVCCWFVMAFCGLTLVYMWVQRGILMGCIVGLLLI